MIDFLIDKNPDEALKSIEKVKRYAKNNLEWRYSEAFLYFWKENYQRALKICQNIKNQTYSNEKITLAKVRQFNLDLINRGTPKGQLYFWIGYLSYFKDKNLENALQDFEKFEELANDNMTMLKQRSSAYLREIKQKINTQV